MVLSLARIAPTAWLGIAGGVAFIAFAVTGAPATLLAGSLADAGIATRALRGTLWRGEAEGLVAGGLRVDTLRWRLTPLALLTGRLQADVDAELPDEGFAAGRIAFGSGRLRLADFTAAAPLGALGPAVAMFGASGDLRVKVEQFEWRDGWIAAVVGSAEVAGIDPTFGAVPGGVATASGFGATFDSPAVAAGDPVTATVGDTGGPLELAATLTLSPPGLYRLEGSAKPRPGAPPALVNGLRLLGPDDGRGGHTVALEGSF